MIIKYLFVWIHLFLFHWLCVGMEPETFTVTFFDVGQGNCTLVDYANKADPTDLILIDCGSSSCQGKLEGHKENMISDIAKQIISCIWDKDNEKLIRGLQIIISHADIDHLGWFDLVLTECKELLEKSGLPKSDDMPFLTKAYLGCEDEYMRVDTEEEKDTPKEKDPAAKTKSKRKGKKKTTGSKPEATKIKEVTKKPALPRRAQILQFLSDNKIPVEFVTEKGNTLAELAVAVSRNTSFKCGILPALKYTGPNKANDPSLVVRIEYDKNVCLLTGDATAATTDHIMNIYEKDPGYLKAAALQASHHGAERDGCNNQKWIQTVSPRFVVFSCGINLGYKHPLSTILRRYFEGITITTYEDKNFSFRSFYTGIEKKVGKVNKKALPFERAHFKDGYCLGSTSKGLFSTLNQGTISLTHEAGDIETRTKTEPMKAAHTCLIGALLKPPCEKFFVPQNLLLLNLSNLGLDDTKPNERKLLIDLLENLTKKAQVLEKFYINNNMLCEIPTMDKLVTLFETLYRLFNARSGKSFVFNIRENHFSQEQMLRIPIIEVLV